MAGNGFSNETGRRAWQALAVWGVFIAFAIIVNGTIPFVFVFDMHAWTYSATKSIIFHLVGYVVLFMVVPVILTKGLAVVRQSAFLLPLIAAVIAITLMGVMWSKALLPTAVFAIVVLAYLHWRFDLSNLGIRSRGWKADLAAIVFMGMLSLASVYS